MSETNQGTWAEQVRGGQSNIEGQSNTNMQTSRGVQANMGTQSGTGMQTNAGMHSNTETQINTGMYSNAGAQTNTGMNSNTGTQTNARMQGNINIVQGNTAAAVNAPASGPYVLPNPQNPNPAKIDTEYTKRMKRNFAFFAPATFLYALLYTFCMFHNGSGVTFPFFVAGSLLYLCLCLSKLEISLQKNSAFYMVSMMLLAVSTFCTDDRKIIAFNKTGIFFLMMSLLLHQFYDTSKWKLGKYIGSIFELVFCSLGELGRPFSDGAGYRKSRGNQKNKALGYTILGAVIAVPILVIVIALLSSADAVFRQMTNAFFKNINFGNIFNVCFRITAMFFASYILVAYLCGGSIKEQVKDRRKGEPVLAITVTSLLSVIYLLFSGIQIIYLFLGQMKLPEGYTYAMYAREGFFQLLAVSILNLIIVLVAMSFFRESKALKIILTIMSLCTFVMIASSALRMIIYIRYYYMTFLRIFVLWALAVLFLLFTGVIVSIYKETFPLFKYSMVVITILYTVLSFSHPDYMIAKINVANAPGAAGVWESGNDSDDFFQSSEPYHDYRYLTMLSADAAPVIIPYLNELGYDLNLFYEENLWQAVESGKNTSDGFGIYYLRNMKEVCDNFSIRTYNVSRHMALKNIEKYAGK